LLLGKRGPTPYDFRAFHALAICDPGRDPADLAPVWCAGCDALPFNKKGRT
jgi:hypothetical protein